MKQLHLITIFLAALVLVSGCDKGLPDLPERIDISASSLEVATTDSLKFVAEVFPDFDKGPKFFYKWDWDGDSVWDTRPTTLPFAYHRFLKPGNYAVQLVCSNGKGQSIQSEVQIAVAQGYSKPVANFSISPETGNFMEEFVFDASRTFDYEDSLSTLLFRWDVTGNGQFEYPFSSNPVIRHQFAEEGYYKPKLEVKDPGGLITSIRKEFVVHKIDTAIHIHVSYDSIQYRVGDTIMFDLSQTTYAPNPESGFKVSWKYPYLLNWSNPSYYKIFPYVFVAEGENKFTCRVIMDYTGLQNEKTFSVFAAAENLPPDPEFEVSINTGNVETQFFFNCWLSRDDHTPTSKLKVRWDWDGDGNWDTPFSYEKEYYHQFHSPGDYLVVYEVVDSHEASAISKEPLTVTPFHNQTGFFTDHRDQQLYGTVRLGDQWWMAENLKYAIPGKTESGFRTTLCLYESDYWCEAAGYLYHTSSIIKDRYDMKYIEVCPDGWRLPTKEDWERLVGYLDDESTGLDLMDGGSTDFNGLYLGQGNYKMVGFPFPTDTVYIFEEAFESMIYASSTIPDDINNTRTDVFGIKVERENGHIWTGFMPNRYYLPVRCVKED